MGVYSEGDDEESSLDNSLVNLCINSLVEAIHKSDNEDSISEDRKGDIDGSRNFKLKLALIFLVPIVSKVILPQILDTIKVLMESEKDEDQKTKLLEALYGKILHDLGAEEKEYVIRWWHENVHDWFSIGEDAVTT